MGARRQAREAAIQALFMCDFQRNWDLTEVEFCFEHFSIPKIARAYAFELVAGIIKNRTKIDSMITCASEHWSIGRMGRVDRSILRLAAYEITYREDIPGNVAINEAIEVAKRYGSSETPMFINGVVDRIAQTFRKGMTVEVVSEPTNEDNVIAEIDALKKADPALVK